MHKKKKFYEPLIIHSPLILFCIAIVLPLIVMVSTSFSGVTGGKFRIIPERIDLTGYKLIFQNPKVIMYGYITSISVTVLGTLMSMVATAGVAYVISRHDFKHRNKISFYIYFTMLFSGGLVPTYILISQYLHLKDTIWVLTLPYMVVPFYVLMLRTFMQSIPMEIIESCYMDGAGEYRIFAQFIIPLSKSGLATIALFTTFLYWNDWWLALLYIENSNLVPLQAVLTRIMNNFTLLTSTMRELPMGLKIQDLPSESMRMGMGLLAAGPILIAFPFFQNYFVRGITIGSLKG